MVFKNSQKRNKQKSRKKGGNRSRSTTLCMYSSNMDNGANGEYGFHPVWGNKYCDNGNLQTQRVNTVSKIGVLGGKPFSNKGGKKTRKRQRGGETPIPLKEALERLKKLLSENEQQHPPPPPPQQEPQQQHPPPPPEKPVTSSSKVFGSGGKRNKSKKLKGGKFASINDGFNCLVQPWNNNTWTKNYNPIAVSDFPSAPSNILPHTNKYIWNQEG